MKEKNEYKHIVVKTSKIFLVFYFMIMIIFSFIYEKINTNITETNLRKQINDLEINISENITQSIKNRNNLITDINLLLSDLVNKDNTNSVMNVALFDDDKKLISKSGNYLICLTPENNRRYIDINKYLKNDGLSEIFRAKNNDDKNKIYSFTVDGYENESEIIPKNININVQLLNDDGTSLMYKRNLLSEYKLPTSTSNTTVNHYDSTELKLLKYKLIIDPTINDFNIYNPYSACTDCFKSNFINLNSNENYSENFYGIFLRNNEIVKRFSIYDKTYYIAFQSKSYPFIDVFNRLIPSYILGLILCIVFISLLSKSFYKIYREQVKLDENRRRMTSAITHEFKTPLGIIRAYSEGIKENIAQDKREHYLDIIIDETYRMDKMVLEMLDLSKLELKLYKLKKETFCINTLVEKVLKNNDKIFSDNNIIVTYKYDEVYEIYADYFRIEQVIQNLISNAVNNTKSKINVLIKEHSVHFINDGNKIDEEKIDFIWELFYKEDNSRTSNGTGIGLAIVKSIIELHNMEVNVKNTENGVDFWFVF